jgi:hypothetical protein
LSELKGSFGTSTPLKGNISTGSSGSLKGSIGGSAETNSKPLKGGVNVGSVLKGDKGEPGGTFIPHLDENGELSWSNDAGLPNPDTINIMGPKGDPGAISDEAVASAVASYLAKNHLVRISEVSLFAENWVGAASPYSQVVTIDGVTPFTQVDLTPSVEQLSIFYEKDLTFVTENEDGIVTVYAIGVKPSNDYTIQVTLTEVIV